MMKTNLIAIAAKLGLNAMIYRKQRIRGAPSLPQAVSLEITRRCVARCIMCNIWSDPQPQRDLSCDQWLSLLDDPLFSRLTELDITGGEPYLREDLPMLIEGVCKMRGRRLPSLASIAITTNGLLGDKVIEQTAAMLQTAQHYGIHLVIVCAVDAVDATHDKIRNHPNAWSKVNRTIETLSEMRNHHPNLILGLKTTIVPMNAYKLTAIRQYALDRGMFTIISPCIITPGRYLNPDRAADLKFNTDAIKRMTAFYRDEPQQWAFHADALVRLLEGRRRKKICSAGYNYFFIRSNGDMMLCPLIDQIIGNITHKPVAELYHRDAANAFRRRVGNFDQCRDCTEPGLERYALAYEGLGLLTYLCHKDKQRFLEEYYHLGLDKLINR